MGRPRVSVIMPVRNEAAFIERSLSAVLAQDYPHELMEVLVVDGVSDDGTPDVVRDLATRSDVDVVVLRNDKRIVPAALNLGIEHATGEIIVRVDGHCEVPPNYVSTLVRVLEQTGADNAGGVQEARGTSYVSRAVARAMSSWFGVGGARFHYATTPGWVDTVYLGAFRREVFNRVGGFDEEFVRTQDAEFNFRLRRAGGRIYLDPRLRVAYYPRPSLRALARQYYEYGVYKGRMARKRRGVAAARQVVAPAFVLGLASSLGAAVAGGRPRLALAVAGPYAGANLVASLWAARHDPSLLPVVPLAFAVMHLAWGAGFWAGLLGPAARQARVP